MSKVFHVYFKTTINTSFEEKCSPVLNSFDSTYNNFYLYVLHAISNYLQISECQTMS